MSYLIIAIMAILILVVGGIISSFVEEVQIFGFFLVIAMLVCGFLVSNKWDKEFEQKNKDLQEHPLTVNTIQEVKLRENFAIQSVSSSSKVNGGGNIFYLYVNTEDVYKVWRNDKEYPEPVKLPTDRTKIIEDSDQVSHVEVYNSVIKGRKYYKDIVSYKLYVPNGTITTDFSIQ